MAYRCWMRQAGSQHPRFSVLYVVLAVARLSVRCAMLTSRTPLDRDAGNVYTSETRHEKIGAAATGQSGDSHEDAAREFRLCGFRTIATTLAVSM
ncbi:uncharacterized protein B0T15DRAFT_320924 [Chaetomium strumarium]|uniref:Uncharacterized protein n=1 Tax=Chaetomium strumarium TaxID=1170767 RepID=A0AAJ0GKQ0_9PEZI|nr:hypothetical protein B0T15DRAFT_320924 [Chaetomium strumarium]